jgi:plastocyanin
MSRFRLALRGAGIAALALVALTVARAAPAPASVSIDNFAFMQPSITVAAGTTVVWTNNDDIPHTVRAVDGSFHSAALDSSDHYSFTFTRPGVYSYFCSLHPKMVGKVIVR